MDFENTGLVLHINGQVVKIKGLENNAKGVFEVVMEIEECFIQCRKHLPKYKKVNSDQSYNPLHFVEV